MFFITYNIDFFIRLPPNYTPFVSVNLYLDAILDYH